MSSSGRVIFQGKTAKGLEVTLRYPQRDDVRAMWEFINELSREQTYIHLQGEIVSLEDEISYVAELLRMIERHQRVQVLAFHGDTLIGNTEITLEGFAQKHIGGLGIAVAQPYRGQGVGELLMNTVFDEAVTNLPGLRMVTLWVFGDNIVGQNLYRKVGYVEYGRLPGGVRHRGEYFDAVYMVKRVEG